MSLKIIKSYQALSDVSGVGILALVAYKQHLHWLWLSFDSLYSVLLSKQKNSTYFRVSAIKKKNKHPHSSRSQVWPLRAAFSNFLMTRWHLKNSSGLSGKTPLNWTVVTGDVLCQSGCLMSAFRAWYTVKAAIVDNQISVNSWFCQVMWKLKSASFSSWFFCIDLRLSFLWTEFYQDISKKKIFTD